MKRLLSIMLLAAAMLPINNASAETEETSTPATVVWPKLPNADPWVCVNLLQAEQRALVKVPNNHAARERLAGCGRDNQILDAPYPYDSRYTRRELGGEILVEKSGACWVFYPSLFATLAMQRSTSSIPAWLNTSTFRSLSFDGDYWQGEYASGIKATFTVSSNPQCQDRPSASH